MKLSEKEVGTIYLALTSFTHKPLHPRTRADITRLLRRITLFNLGMENTDAETRCVCQKAA